MAQLPRPADAEDFLSLSSRGLNVAPTVEPTAISQSLSKLFPLSAQQTHLWQEMQKYKRTNFLLPYPLRISGELNVELLRRSFEEVVGRHESLRARVVLVDGAPRQRVPPQDELRLQLIDLSAEPLTSDMDRKVREHVETFVSQFLDLERGPLLRVLLLQLAGDEHVLVVAIHHIVTDTKSMVIFFRELWSVYGDLFRGQRPSLPQLSQQYPRYAALQQSSRSYWSERNQVYWKRRLTGAPSIRWPIDAGMRNGEPHVYAEFSMSFGETLSCELQALARNERTLLAIVILALFSTVAFCWCGQRDFVVPFNVSGRVRPEHRDTIGFFASTLLLRIQLTGTENFRDLLKLVGQELDTAWQHIDFCTVMAEEPDCAQGAFLQWLSWQPDTMSGAELPPEWNELSPRLKIESFSAKARMPEPVEIDAEPQAPTGHIGISFFDTPRGICGHGNYRADLSIPDPMQQFSQWLKLMAQHVVADPSLPIARCPSE